MPKPSYIRSTYQASYVMAYRDPVVFDTDITYTRHDTGETFSTTVFAFGYDEGDADARYGVVIGPRDAEQDFYATCATSALALEASHRIARERLGLPTIARIACVSCAFVP